jgi:2-C-methyl-D-erythritol 4-phosphate cytidylyltransferase
VQDEIVSQRADTLQPPAVDTLQPRAVDAILPAAGKSRRFAADRKKIFSRLGDRMVWYHAVARLRARPEVGRIVIAIDSQDRAIWDSECAEDVSELDVMLVEGGDERVDSVLAAFRLLGDAQWIAVHDAARPLVNDQDLQAVFAAASRTGAAILSSPIRGTVKLRTLSDYRVQQTVDRNRLWEALTPQVFRADILQRAYQRWNGFPVTDDAQLVERSGHAVCLVEGSPTNIKITVADDLKVAAALLQS